MKVSLIAAVGRNGEIGVGNALPWKLSSDMNFFKERTMGCSVVMGRKTWESIPTSFRPLKGRTNFVVSRNASYEAKGAVLVSSISEALKYAVGDVYIIGGASIYKDAMESTIIEEMILTIVRGDFPEADTFFPLDMAKLTMGTDSYGKVWRVEELLKSQGSNKNNTHDFDVIRFVNAVAEGLGGPLEDALDPLAESDPGVRAAPTEGGVRKDEAET